MSKLRPKQIDALRWLMSQPKGWRAPWWGGRPHSGWPKQMPPQTYNSLLLAGYIKTFSGSWPERTVMITSAGEEALRPWIPQIAESPIPQLRHAVEDEPS